MRFSFSPAYPEWAASSRLRVYTMVYALQRLGYDARLGVDYDADVMVFQKKRGVADDVRRCKGHVIYDFDDPEVNDVVRSLAAYNVRFTTDTEGHRADSPFPERTFIIQDPIDFCPEQPLPLSQGNGLVWFGHETGWPGIEAWVKACTKAGIQVRCISRPCTADSVAAAGAEFVEWSAATFPQELRKSRAALLSHYGSNPGKSNNRAITALAHGLPCVLSDTPEFTDLANEVNSLTCSPVLTQWMVINTQAVGNFLDAPMDLTFAQGHVWNAYRPSVVAKRWLNLVRAL